MAKQKEALVPELAALTGLGQAGLYGLHELNRPPGPEDRGTTPVGRSTGQALKTLLGYGLPALAAYGIGSHMAPNPGVLNTIARLSSIPIGIAGGHLLPMLNIGLGNKTGAERMLNKKLLNKLADEYGVRHEGPKPQPTAAPAAQQRPQPKVQPKKVSPTEKLRAEKAQAAAAAAAKSQATEPKTDTAKKSWTDSTSEFLGKPMYEKGPTWGTTIAPAAITGLEAFRGDPNDPNSGGLLPAALAAAGSVGGTAAIHHALASTGLGGSSLPAILGGYAGGKLLPMLLGKMGSARGLAKLAAQSTFTRSAMPEAMTKWQELLQAHGPDVALKEISKVVDPAELNRFKTMATAAKAGTARSLKNLPGPIGKATETVSTLDNPEANPKDWTGQAGNWLADKAYEGGPARGMLAAPAIASAIGAYRGDPHDPQSGGILPAALAGLGSVGGGTAMHHALAKWAPGMGGGAAALPLFLASILGGKALPALFGSRGDDGSCGDSETCKMGALAFMHSFAKVGAEEMEAEEEKVPDKKPGLRYCIGCRAKHEKGMHVKKASNSFAQPAFSQPQNSFARPADSESGMDESMPALPGSMGDKKKKKEKKAFAPLLPMLGRMAAGPVVGGAAHALGSIAGGDPSGMLGFEATRGMLPSNVRPQSLYPAGQGPEVNRSLAGPKHPINRPMPPVGSKNDAPEKGETKAHEKAECKKEGSVKLAEDNCTFMNNMVSKMHGKDVRAKIAIYKEGASILKKSVLPVD